jgi:hypothetical protein
LKRNRDRFPDDFMFQLTAAEFLDLKTRGAVSSEGRAALRSQSVILKRGRHTKFPPQAFTEHGAIMAATVRERPELVTICDEFTQAPWPGLPALCIYRAGHRDVVQCAALVALSGESSLPSALLPRMTHDA